MINFFKKLILRLYINISGLNFYMTDLSHDLEHNDLLTVKTICGKEIKFLFYMNEINYFYYFNNILFKRKKIIYTVSAKFSDDTIIEIRRFRKLKLHVSSFLFNVISNDKLIYETLLSTFISCLQHELINKEKSCLTCGSNESRVDCPGCELNKKK